MNGGGKDSPGTIYVAYILTTPEKLWVAPAGQL